MIKRFIGKNRFLSNFYLCDVTVEGITYPHSESAFQAMKTFDDAIRLRFVDMDPVKAKKEGRNIPLRDNWNDIKDDIMYQVCLEKFKQNPDIKEKLLATGDEELQEGNNWGDTYWGVCKGEGENKLGKILMRIREELSSEQ